MKNRMTAIKRKKENILRSFFINWYNLKQDSIELNPKPLANAPKKKLLIFLMLLKFEILIMF